MDRTTRPTDATLDPRDDLRTDVRDGDLRDDRDGATLVAHAERLVAGTQRTDAGTVRLSTRRVTEERTITVTVEREELVVEHVDADGRVSEAPVPAAVEGDRYRSASPAGEIVLHEEVVEVVKRTRPVERVRVYVDTTTVAREVTDTVAREVIEVEGDTEHRPLDRDPRATAPVGAEVTDEHLR